MIPKYRAWLDPDMYDEPVIHNGKFYLDWRDFEDGNTYDLAVLMQSTGLKDINGVAIYEGDIVKVTDDFGDTNFSDGGIGTICGLADLYMWYIDGQVQNGLYDIKQCYYIEVIGNIYENPELLESVEE